MRELETTLGGEPVTLTASFKASQSIAEKVGDPLLIAREAQLEAMLTRPGFPPYDPKWKFTTDNVPKILHIGIKASGEAMALEKVQELVFAEGFVSARAKAEEYLALIISPRSEEITEPAQGDAPGE